MALVGDLTPGQLRERTREQGLTIVIGPFRVRLRTSRGLDAFHQQIHTLYSDYSIDDGPFADFHVTIFRQRGLRGWIRPQVQFETDGARPFAPFPGDYALPFWEWGLNYCVATRAHQYLMLHAGVLERNGHALILPAKPGSGKSTLTAALCQRGWRLLSDEFALIQPEDLAIVPFPRLAPLKNNSIEVIKQFEPNCILGPEFPKTRKGRVAHLKPPSESIRLSPVSAPPGWIVFPQYEPGSALTLTPFSKENSFIKLSSNSFNYEFIGLTGFQTAAKLIEQSECHTLVYSALDEAIATFDELAQRRHPGPAFAPESDNSSAVDTPSV